MDIDTLRKENRIIFECITGSRLYGTETKTSDTDYRGLFWVPTQEYAGLFEPDDQINDHKQDIIFYSVKRYFELLLSSNPTIMEFLWVPKSAIILSTQLYSEIRSKRDIFISKSCYKTHVAYAKAQIKKAKGKNRRINNPQPKERPRKEEFCWIIDPQIVEDPLRPIPVLFNGEPRIDLSKYHASSVEHIGYLYRLYYFGEESKGIFRGNDNLTCDSIPKDEERKRFRYLMIYNRPAYERAVIEWKEYWEWMNNRNPSRWIREEGDLADMDCKHMSHCMRLLLSAENILLNGKPIVRFEGEKLEYLRAIRAGLISYDSLISTVESKVEQLEKLMETTDTIPQSLDKTKIDGFYRSLLR